MRRKGGRLHRFRVGFLVNVGRGSDPSELVTFAASEQALAARTVRARRMRHAVRAHIRAHKVSSEMTSCITSDRSSGPALMSALGLPLLGRARHELSPNPTLL